MNKKVKQIRVTVPKWIAELKEWDLDTHLEFVPLLGDDDKTITKETLITLRKVEKNGK